MQNPLGIIAELHRNDLCKHWGKRGDFIALAGQRVYIVFGNPNPFCKLTLGDHKGREPSGRADTKTY